MGSTDHLQDAPFTPLVLESEVRDFTGYTGTRDASSGSVVACIDAASTAIRDDLAPLQHGLRLRGSIDGTGTRFQLVPNRVIMDRNLDYATTAADITVFLVDTAAYPHTYTEATVSSVDGLHGIVTLDSAPASTIGHLEATCRTMSQPIAKQSVEHVALLLSAVFVDKVVREPGKANLANPQAETKEGTAEGRGADWLSLYNKEMDRLRSGLPRAATKNLGLRRASLSPEGAVLW